LFIGLVLLRDVTVKQRITVRVMQNMGGTSIAAKKDAQIEHREEEFVLNMVQRGRLAVMKDAPT